MQQIKQDIINTVSKLVGNHYLYFQAALKAKLSPHTQPFQAWAVCVSPDNELYLMDADEQWQKLEETDLNYPVVLNTLYQRVKLIETKYQPVEYFITDINI